MPNEPINTLNVAPSEWVVLSPAVSEIVERTHEWTLREINKFRSSQMNPFSIFAEYTNSILNEPSPEIFSRIIKFKKLVHEQEAGIVSLKTIKSIQQTSAVADDYHKQEVPKAA